MKSSKQRRLEIKEKRREKASRNVIDTTKPMSNLPAGAIVANAVEQSHNDLVVGSLPLFYIDKSFKCRDCGSEELWTAKQQRWWYEIAKGRIDSTAVRCRKCRNIIKNKKIAQKEHMEKMARIEPHPNEIFLKNT